MAGGRIRTLKPELLEDELILGLSIPARWLFVSCILLSDDHGNMRANPTYLRNVAFGGDAELDVSLVLSELLETKMVESYTVRGQRYLHVRNWNKHQRIDRPGKPKVPTLAEADDSEPTPLSTSAHPIGFVPEMKEQTEKAESSITKKEQEPEVPIEASSTYKNEPVQEHTETFVQIREDAGTFLHSREDSCKFSILNGNQQTLNIDRRTSTFTEQHSRTFVKDREDSHKFAMDKEWDKDQEREIGICTSCINRACAQEAHCAVPSSHAMPETPPLALELPEMKDISASPLAGIPDSERQRKQVDTHLPAARAVLTALNQARMQVVPGARAYQPSYTTLGKIAERLAKGATQEECFHVIAVWEQEIRRNPKSASWFDHLTPFRADPFAQKLALEVRSGTARSSPSVVKNRPTATEDQEFTENAFDQFLAEI